MRMIFSLEIKRAAYLRREAIICFVDICADACSAAEKLIDYCGFAFNSVAEVYYVNREIHR